MVVLAVAVVTTTGFAVAGWIFTSSIDATVTRTVLEPWSNATCQSFVEMNRSTNVSLGTPAPCGIDEPKTRQVDVGGAIWDAVVGRLPGMFLSTFVGWLLIGVGLHLSSALFGGEGSATGSLAVAGWGMAPTLVAVVIGVASFSLTVGSMEFASDPAVLRDQIEALSSTGVGLVSTATALATTLWQGYVWTHGIAEARDLDTGTAAFAAGGVTLIVLLSTLV